MNAATISVSGAALLLACALSPNGYAQTDDGSNENANVWTLGFHFPFNYGR